MTSERTLAILGTTSVVPEIVVSRLPQYVRALTSLNDQGVSVVSSQQLGDMIQMTPAQIRKDLSYFGRFGKQGRGYSVKFLLGELRRILGVLKPSSGLFNPPNIKISVTMKSQMPSLELTNSCMASLK